MFASGEDGMSALSLQRSLEIGSYPDRVGDAASAALSPGAPRPRSVDRHRRGGKTYIGGEEPGLRGGRAKGKKALVGIAVEVQEPSGFGRARVAILADGSAGSLHPSSPSTSSRARG